MNLPKENNPEELFAHIGALETPECFEHRYKLKRALLCSKYFDTCEQNSSSQFKLILPIALSGFFVLLLLVNVPITPSSDSAVSTITQDAGFIALNKPDFITEGLVASFMDDRPLVKSPVTANMLTLSTPVSVMSFQVH